ncbi:MAG: hypothetical protein CMO63_04095 [Verrucomicrobiales bacterium]|nr:hypothetical protein [Verrucomicrobiales bacterium]
MSQDHAETKRILLLTEGRSTPLSAKTATGVLRYSLGQVVGLIDSTRAGKTAGELLGVGGDIPVCASLGQAPEADTLIVGIAPAGGELGEPLRRVIREAIERGMRVESGMHFFLNDDEEFSRLAKRSGSVLVDLRKNDEHDVARFDSFNPDCLRLHTVGNDCCVGKMVVSVELARGLVRAGCDAKFVATGQTGMLIEGDGCAVDSVVSDFIGGATERLVLAAQQHEAIVVEGQGSLANPRYSGVTMGLLHGCLPDGLVMCYEAGRAEVVGLEPMPLPPLKEVVASYLAVANLHHPCRFIGVAINSRLLSDDEYRREKDSVQEQLNLPAWDVVREGSDGLAGEALKLRRQLAGESRL